MKNKPFSYFRSEQFLTFIRSVRLTFITALFWSETLYFVHSFMFLRKRSNFLFVTYNPWFSDTAAWQGALGTSTSAVTSIVTAQIISILLAVGITLMALIFGLRRRSSQLLCVSLLASFPALASGLSQAPLDISVAFCAAACAVFFTLKFKKGFIAGIVFTAISLGAYPSYVSIIITLYMIAAIIAIFRAKKLEDDSFEPFLPEFHCDFTDGVQIDVKTLTRRALVSFGGGAVLYGAVLAVCLNIGSSSLADSMAASGLSQMSIGHIVRQIPAMYVHLAKFLFGHLYLRGGYLFKLVLLVFIAGCAFLLICNIRKRHISKKGIVAVLVLGALLPLFMAGADFVCLDDRTRYFANAYAYVFFFPLALFLLEASGIRDKAKATGNKKAARAALTFVLLLLFTQYGMVSASTEYYSCVQSYARQYSKVAIDSCKKSGTAYAFMSASVSDHAQYAALYTNTYYDTRKYPFGYFNAYRVNSVGALAKHDEKFMKIIPNTYKSLG